MTPRIVAVDMDGTFLHSDNTYDRERFARVRASMAEAGCRFVVASGNQYEQLSSFFRPGDVDAFVAENGALVIEGDRVHHCAQLAPDDAAHVVAVLDALGEDYFASGPEGAFVNERASDAFYDLIGIYYYRLQRVPAVDPYAVPLFKFGLQKAEGFPPGLIEQLDADLAGVMVPVTSGHDSIDFIIPGCHKASGLQRLLDAWGVPASEVVAFGDSGNDLEMLRLAGHGVAMASASEDVRGAVGHATASNNQDGVLRYLETWFGA